MEKELKNLQIEKETLIDEEESIESDIKRLSNPDYIARYAREKYLYSKEGEYILQIPEE